MLRAAKKLTIQSKTFQSSNGFLISPIIDINGLILRADRTMEQQQPIKTFLASKGMVINRVRIAGELFIRIQGEFFNLTVFEINEFVQQYPDLMAEQLQGIEDIPVAQHMRDSFLQQYQKQIEEKIRYEYTDGKKVLTIIPSHIFAAKGIEIKAGDSVKTDCSLQFSGNNINLTGKHLFFSGDVFDFDYKSNNGEESPKAGIMGINVAVQDSFFKYKGKAKLENTVLSSGNMVISGGEQGNLQLEIDTDTEWLNNPYNQCLPMFKAKSDIYSMDEFKQLVRSHISFNGDSVINSTDSDLESKRTYAPKW